MEQRAPSSLPSEASCGSLDSPPHVVFLFLTPPALPLSTQFVLSPLHFPSTCRYLLFNSLCSVSWDFAPVSVNDSQFYILSSSVSPHFTLLFLLPPHPFFLSSSSSFLKLPPSIIHSRHLSAPHPSFALPPSSPPLLPSPSQVHRRTILDPKLVPEWTQAGPRPQLHKGLNKHTLGNYSNLQLPLSTPRSSRASTTGRATPLAALSPVNGGAEL